MHIRCDCSLGGDCAYCAPKRSFSVRICPNCLMKLSMATLKTASSAKLETIRFAEDSTRPDEICLTSRQLGAGMDPSVDDHIAHLLRLKRYELPPRDYFEDFLHEFRRRQREHDELLRQPRWRRIWFERGRYSVFWHSLWPLAYTGAVMV